MKGVHRSTLIGLEFRLMKVGPVCNGLWSKDKTEVNECECTKFKGRCT